MLLVTWLETASAALSSPRDAGERRRDSAQSTYWENVSLDASSLHEQPGARETAVHGCPGSEWTREVLGWHLCGNIKLCKIVSGSHWCKFSGAQLFWFRGLAYFSTVPIQRKNINWGVRVMQKEILNTHLAFSWSIITYSLVIRKVKKHQRKIRKTRQCTSHFCCLQIFWSQLVCLQNYGDLLWFLLIRAILTPDLLCSCKNTLWFEWAAGNQCQDPCRQIWSHSCQLRVSHRISCSRPSSSPQTDSPSAVLIEE